MLHYVHFILLLRTGEDHQKGGTEMKPSGWSLRSCPVSALPMILTELPSFSLPEGQKPGQTALLFIKQEEVLVVGKVSLAQQTSGCTESKSMTQFLSRYNTPVSKENSW